MKHRLGTRISFAIFLLTILSILLVKPVFFAQKPVFLFDHTIVVVGSSSMEPQYSKNAVAVIKKAPIQSLQVGDVVVFRSNALSGGLAFHRIIKITEQGFFTKGDNNKHADNQLITEETYVGVCVFGTNFFAKFLTLFETPFGVLFFALTVIFVVLAAKYAKKLLKKEKKEKKQP